MGPEGSRKGLTPGAFEARALGFIALGIVALGLIFCLPSIPQPQGYHAFADDRTMLGLPNFLNVASNLPFFVLGMLGLWLLRQHAVGPDRPVPEAVECRPFMVFFAGVLRTGFGSSYYHLAPGNDRLVWDRLPITVAFMGFFAGVWCEYPTIVLPNSQSVRIGNSLSEWPRTVRGVVDKTRARLPSNSRGS